MSRNPISLRENIRPIFAAIRTVPIPPRPGAKPAPSPPAPFITISREPGAGAWALARQLLTALNAPAISGHTWTIWDRELVSNVAADQHMSDELIDSLEDVSHSWLRDFLDSLSFEDSSAPPDETRAYARMAATIRALAQAGRVIIIGAGSVFITRHMPGGIHVRLVAPLEKRVQFVAHELKLSHEAAAAYVAEREHNHRLFYKRYWRGESLQPDTFTITLNTAAIEMPTMVDILQALVHQRVLAGKH